MEKSGQHGLRAELAGDHRAETGTQAEVGKATVSLVYVADFEKYAGSRGASDVAVQTAWSNAHAAFIAQNVYFFAASEGLASWFRALVDARALSALLNLRPPERCSTARAWDTRRKRNKKRRPSAPLHFGQGRPIFESGRRESCGRWRTNT
jgi:hypothetical protein